MVHFSDIMYIHSVVQLSPLSSHTFFITPNQNPVTGTSLVAQWLRLCAPNAGGPGSIPGQGTGSHMHAATKSLHATTKEPSCRN